MDEPPISSTDTGADDLVEYPRAVAEPRQPLPSYRLTILAWATWACMEVWFLGWPNGNSALFTLIFDSFFGARIGTALYLLAKKTAEHDAAKVFCWIEIVLFVLFLPYLVFCAFAGAFATLIGFQIVFGLLVDCSICGLLLFHFKQQAPIDPS